MALARVKTWNPGDTLTAADLNGEFNNILNNPISLISPTTGAINFQTSVAHTNLVVTALNASSGLMGQALVLSSGVTPIWGNVGVATVVSSSGDQVFTSANANTNVTVALTGRSSAPRFLLNAVGSIIMSSGNSSISFRIDSTHVGSATFGNQFYGVSLTAGGNFPLSASYVTSALSTAAHTFGLTIISSGTFTLYQTDPTFSFSAVELLGS